MPQIHTIYQFVTPQDKLPTLLKIEVIIRKGVPQLKITGHITTDLSRDLKFYEEILKKQDLLKYQRVTIRIYNPLLYKINQLEDLEPFLKWLIKSLTQKISTSFKPYHDEAHLFYRYFFKKQLKPPHRKNIRIFINTNPTTDISTFLEFLPSLKSYLDTKIYSQISWINRINQTSVRLLKLPPLTQIRLYPTFLNNWIFKPIRLNLSKLPYLEAFYNLTIIIPPCNCGKRFQLASCDCSRTMLHQYLYEITNLASFLGVKKLYTAENNSIPLNQLQEYYL